MVGLAHTFAFPYGSDSVSIDSWGLCPRNTLEYLNNNRLAYLLLSVHHTPRQKLLTLPLAGAGQDNLIVEHGH